MSLKPCELEPINSLWIGNKLSAMELLTLKSFTSYGHEFKLWLYEPLETELPSGVVLCDANQILDKSLVFRYRHSNQYGHGKGSLAGFSDIFRYKLLYELGGWWVDMDVTCLRPFTFKEPYFFRPHHEFPVVGNVMKCPVKSPIMKFCFEESLQKVGEKNLDWNLPIRILNEGVEKFQLKEYVLSNVSPPDQWHKVFPHIHSKVRIMESYYFVHWLNEVWRTKNLNKGVVFSNSTYAELLRLYNIPFIQADINYQLRVRLTVIKDCLPLWLVRTY